ncbi:MAG: lasso peptide biosynthesis B2 protein [Lentisphaeraceae bacterium]|nr:lasso peptide biosynthesis B2 protein [Lentisphaeraceae bacterium]
MLKGLFKLSIVQVLVFIYIYFWLCFVKIILVLFKVKTVSKLLALFSRVKVGHWMTIEKLMGSIRAAEKRFMKDSCLVVALVARMVLAHFYIQTKLHIGAQLDEAESLKAHAWLSYDDKYILVGYNESLESFTEFNELEL